MATYIVLANFTDQGIRNVKGTVDRADAAAEAGNKMGVKVRDVFWTQGQYDVALICDAPDDTTIGQFGLQVATAGNVRFQTLRAFDRDEMRKLLAKLP